MGELEDQGAMSWRPDGKCNRCNGEVHIGMDDLEWHCEKCGVIGDADFALDEELKNMVDKMERVSKA